MSNCTLPHEQMKNNNDEKYKKRMILSDPLIPCSFGVFFTKTFSFCSIITKNVIQSRHFHFVFYICLPRISIKPFQRYNSGSRSESVRLTNIGFLVRTIGTVLLSVTAPPVGDARTVFAHKLPRIAGLCGWKETKTFRNKLKGSLCWRSLILTSH